MSTIPLKNIRNFSIIAHIDHGKSTLADRFIQYCGGLTDREMKAQVLDSMDIERERGITIKAQAVTLMYRAKDKELYQLNFIDTPGHVDFSYEVSRSLAACQGALLVVDAAQGVEAQTVSTCYTAIDENLEVLPVLNKIDLPAAEPERVKKEIEEIIGIDASQAKVISAKFGQGIDTVLEQIVTHVPPPVGDFRLPLQALIIDSWFDSYLGVVSLVCIKQGELKVGDQIRLMTTHGRHLVDQVGVFTPKRTVKSSLSAGDVGFVVAGIKDIFGAPVGDTITHEKHPASLPLPGFKKVKPQVYAGLFPLDSNDFQAFREALNKLKLNDAALFCEPETSAALGSGFRCGFLGVLHMEIIQERLEREYNLQLITTAPTVVYRVINRRQETFHVDNPSVLPEPNEIQSVLEPIVFATILVPPEYLGAVITLCVQKRGVQKDLIYHSTYVALTYEIPMNEVVLDFFDRLKSVSRGFASLDYSFHHYAEAKLVKLDILINGQTVDALTTIVHCVRAEYHGRTLALRLKGIIPRQMFEVAIQAAIGSKIIARETVKPLRKDVTAKCYGGDGSRKKKLLKKQKKGKKRMKKIGKVAIPQEAFLAVLRVKDE